MGWFSKKSVPSQARPPVWLGEASGGFVRSYEAQTEEVYRTNPVGFRAVRMVAQALGGLSVYAAEGDERAAGLVPGNLLERAGASLLLHGNAYVQLLADSEDKPAELALLRPERVSVALDGRGQPSAYLYRVGGAVSRIEANDALARAQVTHVRALTLADDHYGQGCLDAAVAAASVHNKASRWNKGLLDQAARPSGALTYETGDGSLMSAEQFDRLSRELAEQFSGAANAGRPLLLDGGLKWQPLSLTPAEMDFVALKEAAARDIALAFGVPPVLLGLPGDTAYANVREAGRALYRQTVLPLAGQLLDALSAMLSDWMGLVRLAVDTDQVGELAEDRAALWASVQAADFLSVTEKREMLGFASEGGAA